MARVQADATSVVGGVVVVLDVVVVGGREVLDDVLVLEVVVVELVEVLLVVGRDVLVLVLEVVGFVVVVDVVVVGATVVVDGGRMVPAHTLHPFTGWSVPAGKTVQHGSVWPCAGPHARSTIITIANVHFDITPPPRSLRV